MKYKHLRTPFLTISSNLAFLQLPNWYFKISLPPNQLICSSKSYKYGNYDKTKYKVSP